MKRVLLLLSDGLEAYEAAAFANVLGFANTFGDEEIDVVTVGLRPQLRYTFGLTVVPQLQLDGPEGEGFHALAIPEGLESAGFSEDTYSDQFVEVFRRLAAQGKPVAAVCTGALPVARSGVLHGRRAATCHLPDRRQRTELTCTETPVLNEHTVRDGQFITPHSPATAIDAAFAFLEMPASGQWRRDDMAHDGLQPAS